MNLVELYDSLVIPDEDNQKVFNAISVPDYPNFRVAIDIDGNPILLISVANRLKNIFLKNFRLKYLEILQNIDCKTSENRKESFQTFTIIAFKSEDRHLREYFLKVSETFLKALNVKPTQEQIIKTISSFIEIFRSLNELPTKTVNGIWAELFLIESSSNPKILLNYWHNTPEEKFDFNSGLEKIEVKSNSSFERIHTFSSEQLNPPSETQALIASIFMRQSSTGVSIQNLLEGILNKIENDIELTEKLNSIIIKTLAGSLEHSLKIKFDYNIAINSLKFYNCNDIKKIEKVNIPSEVFEVKYKTDLSNINPVNLMMLNKQQLLKSL